MAETERFELTRACAPIGFPNRPLEPLGYVSTIYKTIVQSVCTENFINGGGEEIRTPAGLRPYRFSRPAPWAAWVRLHKWWTLLELNQWPFDYQPNALTPELRVQMVAGARFELAFSRVWAVHFGPAKLPRHHGGVDRTWTDNLLLAKQLLHHWATTPYINEWFSNLYNRYLTEFFSFSSKQNRYLAKISR